jgi:hypothetical protein
VKINSMEEALKNGQMVPSTKAATKMAKNMVMEFSLLQMEVPIQDNSKIMKFQDLENTFGQTTKSMRVCGSAIRCTVRVSFFGKMANDMRASSSMTKERDEAYSSGKTAEYTKANGSTASSTELVFLHPKIRLSREENGKTERK